MKRVLYLDDSDADIEAALRSFEAEGFELAGVTKIEDAFKMLRTYRYDVIIADVMLDGDTGLDFAKRMKAENVQTPLILTSGIPAVRGLDHYHGLQNYIGFVLKPATPRHIREMLRSKRK